MKKETEVRYQTLALKMLELVKGEICDNAVKATEQLLNDLKRNSIIY